MLSNRFIHAVELIKARRDRAAKRKKSQGQQFLQWGFIALGFLSLVGAIFALGALPFYFVVTSGLPDVEQMETLLDPASGQLLQPTRIYDQSGGNLLLTLKPEGIERQFVSLEEIPWLAKAFVASNQPEFWSARNPGMSEWLSPPKTITENLAHRILMPSLDESWVGNFQIHLLSSEIQAKYSNEQILTWAINSADFGHWAFGAESAAKLYFGKPAAQLTLAESAMLVAAAQAPALNPFDNPELSTRFHLLILTSMQEQGLISQAELEQAVAEQLVLAQGSPDKEAPTGFTDLVIEQLERDLGKARIFRGGLVVTTTLDFSIQQDLNNLFAGKPRNAGAVILDPFNDRVLAASGEIIEHHDLENIFSPFNYLSAFVSGESPANLAWDISGEANSSDTGPTTLRTALANNLWIVDESLLKNPEIEGIRRKLLRALGLESAQTGINLLEAGRAYEVFPQNGLFPITEVSKTLLFVSDESGNVILDWTRTDWQNIVSPENAYLVTDVLSDKIASVSNSFLDRPAAFFTDPESSWWLAYSPQRVVVLWDEDHALNIETRLSVFSAAHHGLPASPWDIPAGLNSIIVCVPSGQLPDEDCPETRREWFLRGNEPIETDSLYTRLVINSTNGKLATVFTPAIFVQERVYMSLPSEAESWAEQSGIPPSPSNYDPIPITSVDLSATSITRPTPFTKVSGLVQILGRLSRDTVHYDVQVGAGLYPREWTQLTEGIVLQDSGKFAELDTEGLEGIWAIQLQGWDADGNITRSYTVVTIEVDK